MNRQAAEHTKTDAKDHPAGRIVRGRILTLSANGVRSRSIQATDKPSGQVPWRGLGDLGGLAVTPAPQASLQPQASVIVAGRADLAMRGGAEMDALRLLV